MTPHRFAAVLCALLLPAAGAAPTGADGAGVVVESVAKGYEGEKAGIRLGDILLSWKRPPNPPANPAAATGTFPSPFDLQRVHDEDAQRADSLRIDLRRGGERLSVSLKPNEWRIETRPAFSGERLVRYEAARRRIAEGHLVEGLASWRTLAAELTAAGRHVEATWVWRSIGRRQADVRQVDPAAESMNRAIAAARAAGRVDVEAQLLWDKAEVYANAKRFEEGERALRDALTILERENPQSLAVANALLMMNLVTEPRGSLYESQQRRALRILEKEAPGSPAEANALSGLGTVTEWRGDGRASSELMLRSLSISERLGDDRLVAFMANNLCATELSRGDNASAEAFCARALDVARRLPASEQAMYMAAPHHNLALIAQNRGDLDRAADLLRKALAVREKAEPDSRGVAVHLQDLGLVEMRRGNLGEAERLLDRAARIHDSVAQLNSPHQAMLQQFLAEIAYRRGDLPAAVRRLRDATAFWQPLAPDGPLAAAVYQDLGQVLAEQGEEREAEIQLRHAVAIRRRCAAGSRETAESSHSLGILLWKTGRLAEAEAELRRSIEDLEAQLSRLGGSEEARSAFSAEFADYYRDYLRLLVELRREEDAFLLLERYRAGSFLRTLAQRDLGAPGEVPADLERRRRATNSDYERLQEEIEGFAPATQGKEIDEALARLRDLQQEQAEIAEEIRKASPRYASLRYPRPLGLAETRAALEPGTLLLSFAVDREGSYLFAVPGRGPLSVYRLPVKEKELRESVEAFRRLVQWNRPGPERDARGRDLYRRLLAPAQALVARSERLLIVPDGPLHRLPWAALARETPGEAAKFLAEWKPLHTAVSITVHDELKRARRDGPRDSRLSLAIAAFGDPRYPAAPDARIAARRGGDEEDAEPSDPELRSVARGGFAFAPLPDSRVEVQRIAAIYSPRSAAYLGGDATEERAKSVGRDVPLIHFACHAVINERFPLDSALVFSIPERPAEGRDNGLLQAWEIFEQMRLDADLVTLSACDSGLGREMGGEGLIGLTRAFQYAGARSVLASLWKVEDRATGELMKRFYTHLKSGKTKDDALRQVQIEMIHSAEFSAPRNWAAFQLDGDWR